MNRLQTWFARQPMAIKLAVALPLLLVALAWSTWQSNDPRASDVGNRPVLSGDSARPTPGVLTTQGAPPVSGATADGASGAIGTSGILTTSVVSGSAAAGQTLLPPHQEPQPSNVGITWGTALRTVLSVALVIGLIVVSARALKYFMATAGQPSGPGTNVRVLETTYLPAPGGRSRAAIHLMEVGERVLLVGATDTQLTLLTEFADEATVALLTGTADSGQRSASVAGAGSLNFGEALAVARETSGVPHGANGETNGVAPGKELAEMLRRLRASKDRLESGN